MRKQKTKKIVKKRFKVTKTGKVLHRGHGLRHLRSKKKKSRQRRQDSVKKLSNRKQINMIRDFLQE